MKRCRDTATVAGVAVQLNVCAEPAVWLRDVPHLEAPARIGADVDLAERIGTRHEDDDGLARTCPIVSEYH
jgi:hypothetical protein